LEKLQIILNANVVLENGILREGAVILRGDRIDSVKPMKELKIPENAETVDAQGLFVGPGLVDIHVHGANGKYIYEDPEGTAQHFMKHGHTSVLSAFYDDMDCGGMIRASRNLRNARKNGNSARIIEGIYMEGPYMNVKYGAEAEKKKWNPSQILSEDYGDLIKELGDFAKVWVVAPERDSIEDFVKDVKSSCPDAVISVGHSEATPAQIRKLKQYGLILQTHCMDATGRVGEGGGIRRCGPDEACFLDDGMYAEVICDSLGIHVDPEMLKLILKVKTAEKIILITDSTPGAEAASPEAEDLNFDSQGLISGSRLTLDAACRNMMKHTGCNMHDVFRMASANPARVIGLGNEIGTVEAGKRANLVFVDAGFFVKKVMLEGRFTEEFL